MPNLSRGNTGTMLNMGSKVDPYLLITQVSTGLLDA